MPITLNKSLGNQLHLKLVKATLCNKLEKYNFLIKYFINFKATCSVNEWRMFCFVWKRLNSKLDLQSVFKGFFFYKLWTWKKLSSAQCKFLFIFHRSILFYFYFFLILYIWFCFILDHCKCPSLIFVLFNFIFNFVLHSSNTMNDRLRKDCRYIN